MATEVYTREVIKLQDDTEIVLMPLPIKRLKEFMKLVNNMPDKMSEEDFMDWVVTLATKCLEKNQAIKNIEDIEEVLDLDSAYKIIEICGGVKLNDPKLAEMANELLRQQQAAEAGTN